MCRTTGTVLNEQGSAPLSKRTIAIHRALLAPWRLVGRLAWALPACAVSSVLLTGEPSTAEAADQPGEMRSLVVPLADPARGRQLFVGKGCVVCHSVNDVGGHAGPPLDADPEETSIDVFDFVARMWRGASLMIVLQEMELGYQIELTGEELAHLASFAADADEQQDFSAEDIPELVRDWMVDEVYDKLDLDEMAN